MDADFRDSSMLLMVFGPFTLSTERSDDENAGLRDSELQLSVSALLIYLTACLFLSQGRRQVKNVGWTRMASARSASL